MVSYDAKQNVHDRRHRQHLPQIKTPDVKHQGKQILIHQFFLG